MTLLADVNCLGSQEDLVSNWEPAHSLVEDTISGAEIASCLLALAIACLPLCLWWGEWASLQPASSPLVFAQSSILFFFKFYFIFKLYNIVLVLPNIEMNLPQVYMCSLS